MSKSSLIQSLWGKAYRLGAGSSTQLATWPQANPITSLSLRFPGVKSKGLNQRGWSQAFFSPNNLWMWTVVLVGVIHPGSVILRSLAFPTHSWPAFRLKFSTEQEHQRQRTSRQVPPLLTTKHLTNPSTACMDGLLCVKLASLRPPLQINLKVLSRKARSCQWYWQWVL